jgi:hypothetical protein
VKIGEAEKKVRETTIEIRKVFTNKKWCTWADARLSGANRTAASAESLAKDFWVIRARLPLFLKIELFVL